MIPPVPCPKCFATSLMDCPDCKGIGANCKTCGGIGLIKCDICNGDGFLKPLELPNVKIQTTNDLFFFLLENEAALFQQANGGDKKAQAIVRQLSRLSKATDAYLKGFIR